MTAPDKFETVLAFTDKGETMLIVDARQPGVSVPAHLSGERELRLKFSHLYATGVLYVNAEGVRQVLTFSGRAHAVVIPWHAVIAALSNKFDLGCGWERPPEPVAQVPAVVRLRAVAGGLVEEPEVEAQPAPRKSHLRLVN